MLSIEDQIPERNGEVLPARGRFDYSLVDVEIAKDARAVAEKIRADQRRLTAAVIETGLELRKIRDRLGHGLFGQWLEAEFGWTARTAQNYMAAAAAFGSKCETVSYLPPACIYKLAAPSTPIETRNEIVRRIEAGENISATTSMSSWPMLVMWSGRSARRLARMRSAALRPRSGAQSSGPRWKKIGRAGAWPSISSST
jgi:hypothetical protein